MHYTPANMFVSDLMRIRGSCQMFWPRLSVPASPHLQTGPPNFTSSFYSWPKELRTYLLSHCICLTSRKEGFTVIIVSLFLDLLASKKSMDASYFISIKSAYGIESFGHCQTLRSCHLFLLVTSLRGKETSRPPMLDASLLNQRHDSIMYTLAHMSCCRLSLHFKYMAL